MTHKKRSRVEDAAKEIDDGLGALFGTLSAAIGEMVNRIEDGNTGTVARDHVFETSKGPVRAHAGIRLRMGGLEQDVAAATPVPVNPDRPQTPRKNPPGKPIAYEVLEDDDHWMLTADLPGVSIGDLNIGQNGRTLEIQTSGARRYEGRIDLETDFSIEDIDQTLRNGILTLRIRKAGAA